MNIGQAAKASGVSPTASAQVSSGAPPLLAGLQFVAIAWIVVNQFRNHLGLEAGARWGMIAKGYIGAGLFFVVTGYLLCHQYDELRAAGRFHYRSFLWRRLVFLYPLHVAVLAAMGAALAARILGDPVHRVSFPVGDLPANLLLVQAWGVLRTDSWNFPSWLISADWFAYLAFPLTAWVALSTMRWAILALTFPLALFVAFFLVAETQGVLFTDMTARVGTLQTIPAVLLGAALWRLDRQVKLPRLAGAMLAVGAFLWIVIAASLRLSDLVIWPAFGPLVLGMATMAASDSPPPFSAALCYLGRLSIAMLLVYLPVDMIYFRSAHWVFGPMHGLQAWLVWVGVFPAVLLTAAAAYHGFQRPVAEWLRVHAPLQPKARP
jgi:peptidoglycan/LPS O-acetylase OafA/YrhL